METISDYRIPRNIWEERETNADRMEQVAREFFDGETESAGWFVTHWPEPIAEGSDATSTREWLVCRASPPRLESFYDLLTAASLCSASHWDGHRAEFSPSERIGR